MSLGNYTAEEKVHMRRAMNLSLGVGFFMLVLKTYAYFLTGSAAILSDAAESIVHVLAISFAAFSLWLSLKPEDHNHRYGHGRITFFSAGVEGGMISIAALYIIYKSILKWMGGLHLENLDLGMGFILLATILNGLLGGYLIAQGRKYHSLVLEANGKHVLTDSWTSLGVIIALLLTKWTGWLPFDPILAILVAFNILWTGGRLVWRCVKGLMDATDLVLDAKLQELLEAETKDRNLQYHSLRHRYDGSQYRVEFHLRFPHHASVAEAHSQATSIEKAVEELVAQPTHVITHLEPL